MRGSQSGVGRQPCAPGREPGCWAGTAVLQGRCLCPKPQVLFPASMATSSFGSRPFLGSLLCGTPNGWGDVGATVGSCPRACRPVGPVCPPGGCSSPFWGEHTSLQTVSSGSFIPLGFRSREKCLPLHRTKQRFLSRERKDNVFPQCGIPDDFRTQKRESYKTKAGNAGAVVESPGSFLGKMPRVLQ